MRCQVPQLLHRARQLLAWVTITLFLAAKAVAAPNWGELQRKPDPWFQSAEGLRVTTNVLSWQSVHGSWPKNMDTTAHPNLAGAAKVQGTFDNGATTDELRFLARAFRATENPACREAVLRGIDCILTAQYPTGGWPQSYPPNGGYSRYITFNDGSMVRLLEFLREVATAETFAFVGADKRRQAQMAIDRGVECILKCQIPVEGRLTVWCAQHDEKNYEPRPARTYELVSLSGAESAGVLGFLMSLDHPSPAMARAITAGVEWFETAKLQGIRAVRTNDDRIVVNDPAAPPLWARFYEIGSNRPIFSGRDGVKKYSLAEIEKERRGGYAWYGTWGEKVARDFARWRERWPQAAATAEQALKEIPAPKP